MNLFCLPVTLSVKEAAKLLVQEGYSRTPVFRENIDQMIGVLMFKDILELYMDTEAGLADRSALNQSIESLVKPFFIPLKQKKYPIYFKNLEPGKCIWPLLWMNMEERKGL